MFCAEPVRPTELPSKNVVTEAVIGVRATLHTPPNTLQSSSDAHDEPPMAHVPVSQLESPIGQSSMPAHGWPLGTQLPAPKVPS